MSLRLLMDHHVPAAISTELRRRGIDVLTAQEEGQIDLMMICCLSEPINSDVCYLVLLRYAYAVAGPLDYLAPTCLHRVATLPALNLCTAYDAVGERITHLPLAPAPDLDHQAGLTRLLTRCRPFPETVAGPGELAERLSATRPAHRHQIVRPGGNE